jgi:hypothetical protein
LSITAGTRTISRRRITVAMRRTGATTSMSRKAQASANVTGKPRRNFFHPGSGMLSGDPRFATTAPTTTGTRIASAIQITRSQRLGTDLPIGTKATMSSAIFGTITPSSRMGQAAAAATTAESRVCSLGEVVPKSARTAQPKMAFRALPADLPR